jgi:hypothetical protein
MCRRVGSAEKLARTTDWRHADDLEVRLHEDVETMRAKAAAG